MITMRVYNTRNEWLEARTSCIGGSDAGAILGINPYKDNVTLWKEKIGLQKPEDISDKDVVKYGIGAEPLLRELFKLDHPEYEVGYAENNMWTNTDHPFAHASLDGWLKEKETGRLGGWECKTSLILDSRGWDKWDNKVPDTYFAQILHYFAVTGFEFFVLLAQIKYIKDGRTFKTTREYHFERSDYLEDIEYLIEKEKAFADCIYKKSMPNMILPTF